MAAKKKPQPAAKKPAVKDLPARKGAKGGAETVHLYLKGSASKPIIGGVTHEDTWDQ